MTYFHSPLTNDWQRQVITGTILGGSSIVKPLGGRNCYLFMRSKNRDWIKYKAEELKSFSSQNPFTYEGTTLRWHSSCYPLFNEFRESFYVADRKTITMSILDTLRDIGLAIWFGDAGKFKKGHIWLNTHKFGEEGTKVAAKYFNEVDIECDMARERNNHRIKMTKRGSETFLATIGHQLPEFIIATLDHRSSLRL